MWKEKKGKKTKKLRIKKRGKRKMKRIMPKNRNTLSKRVKNKVMND